MNFMTLIALSALCSGGLQASGAFASCPDLALVLAIDGSGSINDKDFLLQQQGYAAAFADRRVQSALMSVGVVDIAVVLWGDDKFPPQILPWKRVSRAGSAEEIAHGIAALPRKVTGNTGIGGGLWAALDLLQAGQACATRKVINVSGDGKESVGPRPRHHVSLAHARNRAAEMGVTINALAITVEAADLEAWYRERVITGPGAFVMTADSFDAFREAIKRKLAREIAAPALAEADIRMENKP